ncbi:unnamed protein product [Rotaria sp. Silwood1]|nr:unnamed protein product [Rotaria sp. Silwood1]CAF4716430.1 unnamed protein product [Rotaria sp. Silwood1]
MEFPISPHFWSLVPRHDYLISLNVLSNNHDDNCQNQLKDLLDRASHLSSICIDWQTLSNYLMQLFQSRHVSVYQLELLSYGQSLNREQCTTLSSIIPSIDCEVLNVFVIDRTCILALVKTIQNLRALNIRCENDRWNGCSKLKRAELCECLQEELSSTFFSGKISRQDNIIRFWIR